MNNKPEFPNFSGPDESQAELLLRAWTTALEGSRARSLGCPESSILGGFTSGRLAVTEARGVLAHLASCSACRAWERAIEKLQSHRPATALNLVRLRQQGQLSADTTAPILREFGAWVESLTLPDPGEASFSMLAEVPGTEGTPSSFVEFGIESPPRIDQQGRFRMTVRAFGPTEEIALVVALQDDDRRLEVCALPLKEEDTVVVADFSILDVRPGRLNPEAVNLTVVTASSAESWNTTKMIPSLRRILNCHLEPVEFWDAIRVVFAEAGKDWGKTLHLEMMALDSPSTVMPLLGAVANALQDFAEIWKRSNGCESRQAEDALRTFNELRDATIPGRGFRNTSAKTIGDPKERAPRPRAELKEGREE